MSNYYMLTPDRRYDNVLFLYEAGYEKNKSDSSFGPSRRDFYLMHYLVSGAGYFEIDGKTFRIEKGDAFMIMPHLINSYRADERDPYEYYWLGFNGPSANEVVKAMGFSDGIFVRKVDESLHLGEKLEKICKNPSPDIKSFLSIYSGFYEILSLMTAPETLFDRREFGKDYAILAAEYVERNYMNDLTVTDLSEYLNLSRSQVFRIFKKTYNVSPVEYIANFRLNKAVNMIKKTDKTIQEIAYQCGYKSVSHFISRYKRKHGITPLAGRRLEEFTKSLYDDNK